MTDARKPDPGTGGTDRPPEQPATLPASPGRVTRANPSTQDFLGTLGAQT